MEKSKEKDKKASNEELLVEEVPKEQKKDNKVKYYTEIDEPPLIIMVQGGHSSGKTTLIKSLVKYYTSQNISSFKGSITVRNSKNQRLTFIECPNDISSLDDCSKIVDVAILLIDARVGFEMETFEFISLLKNYLFGIKNNLYIKLQLHTMARYLKVIKPSQPLFRVNHPYIFCDRYDLTFTKSTQDNDNDDVIVSLFGYVRGNHLNKNSLVHINGLGEYKIDFAIKVDDPCPIEMVSKNGKIKRTFKKKR